MRSKKPFRWRLFWQQMISRLGWLMPGLGIKRWLVLILIGMTLLGVGFALYALDFYRNAPETWWLPVLSYLSLRFLARWLRVVIFGGLGVGLVLYGIWGLNRALLKPFLRPGQPVLDTVSSYRKRERGPRVVVIGGGTGQSTLLRGIKAYTHNITAIVSVADDGGSSGELRRSLGVLPPGDIRACLAALSDDEELLTQIFQYRFASGAGVGGHNLGNLFITALAEITGSFEKGVAESGRVLAIRGRVLPSTLHDVKLVADISLLQQEVQVKGESQIPKAAGRIQRVWLEPNNPLAYPPAIQAILSADLIIIGPGSLFTSILPNLLVPDLAAAIRSSRAYKFYVCNVASQPGETDGFTCGDYLQVMEKHLGGLLFDVVICNQRHTGSLPPDVDWVRIDPGLEERAALYCADLTDETSPWRHDASKLAKTVIDLFNERTGPLLGRSDEEKQPLP
ncbi:MAG TPA: YvcK family protein [Anaerolineaceae bacterium]|nr:YvcK family protein [Anaerolineaceae bacterium]